MTRNTISVTAVAVALMASVGARAQVTFNYQPVLTGATTPSITGPGTAQIAADPVNPEGAWACFGNIPNPALGTEGSNGCWRTDDWGDSWTLLSSTDLNDCPTDGSPSAIDVLCQGDNVLEIAVCNPNVLAVGVHEKGFFLSEDAGVTWTNISLNIEHDDSGAGHFDSGGGQCLPHGLQTFDERRSDPDAQPWSGLAIAFDPSDTTCNTIWAGVGDVAGFSLTGGLGDHPGVYVTADGGASWEERNGGDYDAERADPLACHPLSLTSHTAAPTTLAITPAGTVLMNVVDGDLNASLFGTKTACSQPRVFQLDSTSDITWTEQTHPTLDAGERCISTSGFGLSAASITFGQFSQPPGGPLSYVLLQNQNISTIVDATLVPSEWKAQSQGLIGGLVANPISWVDLALGLPVITDDFNTAARNVSPASISPSGVWLIGTVDSDGQPPFASASNQSFCFASPSPAAPAINTSSPNVNPSCSGCVSPDGTLFESSVLGVTWNSSGQKLMGNIGWYDNYDPINGVPPGKPVEIDDGLYRACPFNPGGNC